jgi:hypothetical protein
MPSDHEQTPRKLVYLRDHAPRPRTRASRSERKPPPVPHIELVGEAAWLGRSLLAIAGGIAVYWLLIVSGAVHAEGDAWNWSVSRLLAHFYVAVSSVVAARRLLRGSPRAPLLIAFAASSLIVVSIEGLAHLMVTSDLSRISLAARTDILTRTAMLALGVWATSYALRTDRRGTPPA